jgi:hypothetical protein
MSNSDRVDSSSLWYFLPGRSRCIGILLVAASLLMVGCGPDLDPTDPSGGYNLYRKGLMDNDPELVWKRLDERSRAYFERQHQQLVRMDGKIKEYLPPADHRLARKQSGTILLDEVDGAKELFNKVVDLKKLAPSRATELGSLVGKVRIAKNKETAQVETRGGRTYELHRKDGEWYVNLVDSVPEVDKAFGWLDSNKEALNKTVQDRSQQEQARREEIIAQLFNVDGG